MNRILDFLSRFFHGIGRFFDGLKTKPIRNDRMARMKTLLSKDALAESEQRELAALLKEYEGAVVFLDSTSKEEL